MFPFVQNAENLRELHFSRNNITSEGFNILVRALHGRSIERLELDYCGVSILLRLKMTFCLTT
jgi:hypothetical protein